MRIGFANLSFTENLKNEKDKNGGKKRNTYLWQNKLKQLFYESL